MKIIEIHRKNISKTQNMAYIPFPLVFSREKWVYFCMRHSFGLFSYGTKDDVLFQNPCINLHLSVPSSIIIKLQKMSQEDGLSPLSFTVNSKHHTISLNLEPVGQAININVKDTRTKELLIQRIDAKYIEDKEALAAIGDFNAVYRYILRNIWDIAIQNGAIRFQGEKPITVGLRSAGPSWTDLSHQTTDKLNEFLQEQNRRIISLEQSNIAIQAQINQIISHSAAEIARLQALIARNKEEQAAINASISNKVDANKKEQQAINASTTKLINDNKATQDAINLQTDKKIDANKKEQQSINASTTKLINDNKASQDAINVQTDKKIDANKAAQDGLNGQFDRDIDFLMAVASIGAIYTHRKGRENHRFKVVNSTTTRGFLRYVDSSGEKPWFNADNVLNRRVKYIIKLTKFSPTPDVGAPLKLGVSALSNNGGHNAILYDTTSGTIRSGGVQVGSVDRVHQGGVVEMEYDFPGKKFKINVVGGGSFTGDIGGHMYSASMHLVVMMWEWNSEVEIECV